LQRKNSERIDARDADPRFLTKAAATSPPGRASECIELSLLFAVTALARKNCVIDIIKPKISIKPNSIMRFKA
jgi:hypothetical protein